MYCSYLCQKVFCLCSLLEVLLFGDFYFLTLFFINKLIYNVLAISAVQQNDPDIYIYIFTLFSHYLPSCLSQVAGLVPCAME